MKKKYLPQYIWVLALVAITLFGIIGAIKRPKDVPDEEAFAEELPLQWTLTEDINPELDVDVINPGAQEETELPYYSKTGKAGTVRLQAKLPLDVEANRVICIRADQLDIKAYVGDELRAEYSTENTRYFGKVSPRRYLFMELRDGDAGRLLTLEVTNPLADTGRVSIYAYGDKADILGQLIKDNLLDTAVGIIMLIICIMCLAVAIIFSISRRRLIDIIYMPVMGILASIWILCNCEISQLYFMNRSLSVSVDYMMLMMLPFPFLFYMNSVQRYHFNIVYKIFEYIAVAEVALCTVFQLAGYKDYSEMFLAIAAVFGGSLFMILITICVDIFHRHNYEYLITAIGIFAGVLATFIQLIMFAIGIYQMGGTAVAIALLIILFTSVADTTRKIIRIERGLQEAVARGKAESTFLANMSHEIRTPINAVLGMNEMILRESKEPQIREYSENIASSGNMLLSIVNDILDFSKIRSGKMEIIADRYSLKGMIDEIAYMMKPRAEAKNLEFKMDIDGNTPNYLNGDVVRIKQICINLMTNAVKYTERGYVALKVTYEMTDDKHMTLRIAVSDSGKGIREEDQRNLFDAFSRVDEKSNRSIEGTGLGLALVSNFAESMGGGVGVVSEYGKGSTFFVELPQEILENTTVSEIARLENAEGAKKPEAVKRAEDKPLIVAPGARVLVVDDTAMNLKVIKALLKRTKINVTTAGSAAAGLDLLRENAYDVAFIDHLMPVMDGEEMLGIIRNENLAGSAKVVALTANAIDGARERYLAMGFDDYLAKPVKAEALESMLCEYIPKEKQE